jgi:hypothetical protein
MSLKLTLIRNVPVLPALPPWLAMTQGNIYYVRPRTGNDGSHGRDPDHALQSLDRAQALMTADQNDICVLMSESNTAASTTNYLTTTLLWAKDGCHLIGVCAGGPYNKRARIAWLSTAASGSDIPLVTVSADNCYIANISLNVGSADANLSFGLNVTGDNNLFENVDVAFPTNAANDCAGAYAVKIDGCDQTSFKGCTFGSFTVDLGTAENSLVLIDSGCSMVKFINCDFIERIEHTTNSPYVRTADANALGFGCVWFENCNFISTSVSSGYAMAAAMTITASQVDGRIVLANCWTNAAKWDNTDANMILMGQAPTPAADTGGVTRAV